MAKKIVRKLGITLAIAIAFFIAAAGQALAQERVPLTYMGLMMNPVLYSVDHYFNHYGIWKGKVPVEGVKLDYKTFWVWDSTRLMAAGEGDVGVMTVNSYLMAKDRAAPLVMIAVEQIVMPIADKSTNMVFVRADSAIRTPKDLEGKKMGLPGLVSASAIYHRAIFQHRFGIDLGKITWVDKGTPELYTLLKKGEIDAVNVFGGVADKAMKDPALRVLYIAPIVWKEMTGLPFMTTVIVARKSVLEKHPGAVKNMLKALKLSKKYGEEHRKEIMAEALKEFREVEEPGTIDQPFELTEEHKRTVMAYAKYSLEQKIIRKEPDLADLFADLK